MSSLFPLQSAPGGGIPRPGQQPSLASAASNNHLLSILQGQHGLRPQDSTASQLSASLEPTFANPNPTQQQQQNLLNALNMGDQQQQQVARHSYMHPDHFARSVLLPCLLFPQQLTSHLPSQLLTKSSFFSSMGLLLSQGFHSQNLAIRESDQSRLCREEQALVPISWSSCTE